jgi:hypothetical protein
MQTVSHERHLHVTTLSPVFAFSCNFTPEWRGSRLGMVHNTLAGQLAVWYLYLRSIRGVSSPGDG